MVASNDTVRLSGAPQPQASDEFRPGDLIGLYVVERLAARGGHGAVYLAVHRVVGRRAAVKVLRRELATSGEMLARFVREARVVNRIRHADIVDIYDLGTTADGRPYCVMEWLEGRGLDEVIRERAPLAPAEAVALLAPVCRALQAAHEAGVVHRDVKASNVMVVAEGPPPRVKLLDFGIAKANEPGQAGLTAEGERLGTMVVMAPEQIAGHVVDARADVYAMGVLLYQLLTGRPPFAAPRSEEVERMHLESPPPRPSQLAPAAGVLDAVVARCLAKAPSQRFPSAAALLEAALEAAGTGPAGRVRRVPALAIHVVLRTADDPDDEALAAQAAAADAAELQLVAAGYQLPVATTGAIVGVRLLPDDPALAEAAQAEASRLAGRLAIDLARHRLAASVKLRFSEAEVRDGAGGVEVVGGPVCEVP